MTGSYVGRQQEEIGGDEGLHKYGLFLIIIHIFTSLFWFYGDASSLISGSNLSYCWPFFSSCDLIKYSIAPIAKYIIVLYATLSVLGFFFALRSVKNLWWILLSLEIYKLAIGFLDYKFMGNYHFMPHMISLFYLLVPRKRFWVNIWLITFYYSAVSLKLNFEWLSGGSLSWKIPFNNVNVLIWGAFLVVPLEILTPVMSLQKEKLVRYTGIACLTIFHVVSFYWVGFFYPCVMLSLLSLWIFSYKHPHFFNELQFLRKNIFFLIGFIVWIAFVLNQIVVPFHSEEYSLKGERRLFSLNMFDANAVCLGFFIINKNHENIEVAFKNDDLPVRVQCDEIMFREQGRRLCAAKDAETGSIEAYLYSRTATGLVYREIIREQDICQRWK